MSGSSQHLDHNIDQECLQSQVELPPHLGQQQNTQTKETGNQDESLLGMVLSSKYSYSQSKCEQCEQRFNKRSHLYRHMREKHQQNHPEFSCTFPECQKIFKRGSHLRRHMISHTHQKKFKCLLCVMEFGYKHHLDRHIKIVHNKVLFKCDECGSEFNKKRGLSKHKKEHQKKRARTGHSLTTIREEDAQPVVHEEDMNDHSSSGHHSASVNKTHLKLNELINKDVENEKDEDDELFDDLLEEEQNERSKSGRTAEIKHYENYQQGKGGIINKLHQLPRSVGGQAMAEPSKPPIDEKTHSSTQSIGKISKTQKISKKQKSKQNQFVYRCTYGECLHAYKYKYALKNHIKNIHQESSQPSNQMCC